MDNFVLWLNDFAIRADFSYIYRALFIVIGGLGVISILISAIVYGYPRVKKSILFLWVISGVGLYYLGWLNFSLGGAIFINLNAILKAVFLTFGAIIGLYVGFYLLVLLICFAWWRTKKEVTASLCTPLAVIEELPKLDEVKVKTSKLCVKKPRLDDKVNFFKLEEYITLLKSKPTPAVLLAEIEFCERVIKHLKNTILNDKTRLQLNEVMQTLVKIGAQLGV